MADNQDFGERAATTSEVADFVTLVRSAKTATRAYKPKPDQPDRMRPVWGSGQASSEGDE